MAGQATRNIPCWGVNNCFLMRLFLRDTCQRSELAVRGTPLRRGEKGSANAEIQPADVLSRFDRADNSARLVVFFIRLIVTKAFLLGVTLLGPPIAVRRAT